MQLKILVAVVMLLLLAEPIANFIDNYIGIMFDYMQNELYALRK